FCSAQSIPTNAANSQFTPTSSPITVFLLLQRMFCFHEGLIAESDSDSRQHLSIRSGNKMYPLLGPLTRDIVCRLDQFVAARRTSISAKMTKIKLLFSTVAAARPL